VITGTHAIIYSEDAQALREFFRDVLEFDAVDTGGGWLIFALPPAELGVHAAEGPTFDAGVRHQLSFMCDDIATTVADLRARGIEIRDEPVDEGYGITTTMTLPGGVDVVLYQPRHETAI